MHELSIASAVLNTAVKHAHGRRVTLVAVQAGALRQVVPASLEFYWDIVARDTDCEGAVLELTEVGALLRCGGCGHEWSPDVPVFRCGVCGAGDVEVAAGEELCVEYIEVEETEAACIAPR